MHHLNEHGHAVVAEGIRNLLLQHSIITNDGWLDLMTAEIVHWDVGSSSDPSELLLNQQSEEVI